MATAYVQTCNLVFFQAGVFKGLAGTHLKAAAIVTSSLKVSPPCGNCRTWLCYSGCTWKGSASYYGLHGYIDLMHVIAYYLFSIRVPSSRLRRHLSPFLWAGPIGSHKFWAQLRWPAADRCYLTPLRSALRPNVTPERLLGAPSSLQHAGRGNQPWLCCQKYQPSPLSPLPHPQLLWGSPTGSWLTGLTVVRDGSDFHFHLTFVHGAGYTGQPSEVFCPVLAGVMARADGNEQDGWKCTLGARGRQDCCFWWQCWL